MYFDSVFKILNKEVINYKVPIIDLIEFESKNIYRILVGTILSARTKDNVTTKVCEKLFDVAPDFHSLSILSVEEIEKLIYPVGFFRNKAKNLSKLPDAINELGGNIPNTWDNLMKLPGVGRKTANLVLAVGFKIPAICVDTHVHTITNRLGWVKTKNPLETEMELRKILPKKYWLNINRVFVAFGQNVCRPISPWCSMCPISKLCPKMGVKKFR